MKFTVDRDVLLEPLQLTTSVVERKQTQPILSNLLLEAQGSRLTMISTDQEVELRTVTNVIDCEEPGEVCVSDNTTPLFL